MRALFTAGEEAAYYHTRLTPASTSRAKAQLGFARRPPLHLSAGADYDMAMAFLVP